MKNTKEIAWCLLVSILLAVLAAVVLGAFGEVKTLALFLTFMIVLFSVLFVLLFVFYDKEKKAWFFFAYVFMLVAVGTSIVPFAILKSDRAIDETRAVALLVGCRSGEKAPAALKCGTQNQWVINIGGIATLSDPNGIPVPPQGSQGQSHGAPQVFNYRITGGLVVPMYFIIFALVGGAVSLTRRVPEYQKRSEEDYQGTETEPKLPLQTLREYLVFQIVQFISAPYIAVVAYYIVEPDTLATSATLAFTAGFASESILLLIRGAAKKLRPSPKVGVLTGSAYGKVSDSSGPVKGAHVSVSGRTGLETRSDDAGLFALDRIPAGPNVLKVVEGTRAEMKGVKIDPNTAARCDVTL